MFLCLCSPQLENRLSFVFGTSAARKVGPADPGEINKAKGMARSSGTRLESRRSGSVRGAFLEASLVLYHSFQPTKGYIEVPVSKTETKKAKGTDKVTQIKCVRFKKA